MAYYYVFTDREIDNMDNDLSGVDYDTIAVLAAEVAAEEKATRTLLYGNLTTSPGAANSRFGYPKEVGNNMYMNKNQVRALGNILNHIVSVWDDMDIALCEIKGSKINITTPHPKDDTDVVVTEIIIDNGGDITVNTNPKVHTWLNADDIEFIM
jgi:hypothetical protein